MVARRTSQSSKKKDRGTLEPIQPMVAGVDIGSTEHWVCGPQVDEQERPVKVFGATTPQLQEMVEWLRQLGVKSVAMESTYIYWIPLFDLLESAGFEVILVNARTLHNVPGRKTDMKDCQWLQLLHSCGLLRGSFRPRESISSLRTLRRQRSELTAERTKFVQWMQKALDQMNIRVHRAVSDVTGATGMAIIRAIVSGERDAKKLAEFRDTRCKNSVTQIAEELTGTWRQEHLFNLANALELFDVVEAKIKQYDDKLLEMVQQLVPPQRIELAVPPHPNPGKQKQLRRRGEQQLRTMLCQFSGVDLTIIDGISAQTAQIILTEIGPDLSAFPTEKHLISWMGLAPRRGISGGKAVKKRNRGLGASRVAEALRMAAVSVQRTQTALGATYRRVARYRGAGIAVKTVARKIACYVYRLLRFGQAYIDIGAEQYEERYRQQRMRALKATAQQMGLVLIPAPTSATSSPS